MDLLIDPLRNCLCRLAADRQSMLDEWAAETGRRCCSDTESIAVDGATGLTERCDLRRGHNAGRGYWIDGVRNLDEIRLRIHDRAWFEQVLATV